MNEKIYTIEELKNNNKIAVLIETTENVKKFDKYFRHDKATNYYYNQVDPNECLSTYDNCHASATWYKNNGYEIIKFSQIDFQETPVNLLEQLIIW